LGRATDEVITALLAALRDEDGDVRRAAGEALGELGRAPDEVTVPLIRHLVGLLGYRWYLPWHLPWLPRSLWLRRRGYDQEIFDALWAVTEKAPA
jgi:HEAT repeat protein